MEVWLGSSSMPNKPTTLDKIGALGQPNRFHWPIEAFAFKN